MPTKLIVNFIIMVNIVLVNKCTNANNVYTTVPEVYHYLYIYFYYYTPPVIYIIFIKYACFFNKCLIIAKINYNQFSKDLAP